MVDVMACYDGFFESWVLQEVLLCLLSYCLQATWLVYPTTKYIKLSHYSAVVMGNRFLRTTGKQCCRKGLADFLFVKLAFYVVSALVVM
jgi:hypothetical protein